MDDKQIRKIVQEELKKSDKQRRFGMRNIPLHTHNGTDSPQVPVNNLLRNPGVLGSVTFAQQGEEYTFNIDMPQTPNRIDCNGIVYDTNRRILTNGVAYLGEGYYLQPSSSTSVSVGDIKYPAPTEQPDGSTKNVPIQGSSWLWTNRADADNYSAGVSENHIVSVTISGTIYARVTVVDFSKDKIVFSVPYLESGYEVIANFLIS